VTEPTPATPEAQAEAPAEAPGQPAPAVEYTDFAVPDGMEMDAEVLTNFKGIAKELGIPQEAAQKLIDLQASMETKRSAAAEQAQAEQAQQWAAQIKADKELGGENYDKTLATVTVLAADLVAGYQSPVITLPQGCERYIRLNYTVTGTAPTTGKVTAGIVAGVQTNG